MNLARAIGSLSSSDLPLISDREQLLFTIEDTRKRADQLQEQLVPKLKTLLTKACSLINEIYGEHTLSSCRTTTTPAHRPNAKQTKPFEVATAGLAIEGQAWFFQQRFECAQDRLYVNFFGLRGLEGNPIIQVLKKYPSEAIRLLEYGEYELYSETIESPNEDQSINFIELISRLQLVPEREWKGTYISGTPIHLPVKNVDRILPALHDFIVLFPIFRAAANVLNGKDDCFRDYTERFWRWQSKHQTPKTEPSSHHFPDEVDTTQAFREGAVKQVLVNTYERDPKARQRCIDHYGSSCVVCGFNFGKIFGPLGEGFIHIHHLRPIAEIGEEYEVDPVKDLRPVCPNCHAMIHHQSPALSIGEMKILLETFSKNCAF
ncbi:MULTISPECIES: HNH endonuclease [unclassified Leptolyngbya]|uniref:HNH endonuclease n=1 Tax=unclassified Leptolyngbya TaxID=2650499 RepID=UPI00168340B3|nr:MULTISPECIES: HNH endonuclease [unclassified Leptolyngbya]MBD1910306.1 HNH endonuclease [Leptolyngbya sp. FACHB-8]MBD2155782.1 HNH endonuclease [Leptolyngbya sp. FACHB-16]